MDMLVTATAVAFLGALSAYVAMLTFSGLRQMAEGGRHVGHKFVEIDGPTLARVAAADDQQLTG